MERQPDESIAEFERRREAYRRELPWLITAAGCLCLAVLVGYGLTLRFEAMRLNEVDRTFQSVPNLRNILSHAAKAEAYLRYVLWGKIAMILACVGGACVAFRAWLLGR